MNSSAAFLNPSEAARRLGVSTKALRLYEQRGLVDPVRTQAGWRTYGPVEMARAAEIVALRALGLSLAQVARVLDGDPECLEPALATHQATLEGEARDLADTIEKVRSLRAGLARGEAPAAADLATMVRSTDAIGVAFDLPWPWGSERFALHAIAPLTYIIGPLGSGKTRLAMTIAEALLDAEFLGLDRAADAGGAAQARLDADPALKARVARAMAWLDGEGAYASPALTALLTVLEAEYWTVLVVDMVERGLNRPTQEALVAFLRRRAPDARPIFAMTRSSAILDLAAVGPREAIIYCPANHAPPIEVAPYPGAPGYEAVATCLASPEVRARTEGVIARRPRRA